MASAALCLAALWGACADSTGLSNPSPGGIVVTVEASGADLDADGYTILLDGGTAQAQVPKNGGDATFPDLTEGAHTVDITGVAANCTVSGQTSETVTVTATATARADFRVTCLAFGAVRVAAATSGTDLDPDGYSVDVDGQLVQVLPINGAVFFSVVAPGPRVVTLSGVSANCTVSGGSQVTVTVPSGAMAEVAFAITCSQIMPTGSAIAFTRYVGGNNEVFLVSAGLSLLNLTNSPGADGPQVWSPDGTKVAFVSNRDGNAEIYVMNSDGSGQRNLTNNAAAESSPLWSPDGTKIAFVSDRDGNAEVYAMNADGSAQTNLTNNSASETSPAWSPDGTRIAFVSDRDGNQEIYLMNADGSGQRNLTNSAAAESSPAWSPDGTKIAFVSNRDGNAEVYAMNADGTGQANLTNNVRADLSPAWSPDGRRIAFTSDGIAVINADGTGFVRIMANTGCGSPPRNGCIAVTSSSPVWSPDATRIAFQWRSAQVICPRGGGRCGLVAWSGISLINPDGSAAFELVRDAGSGDGSPVWRPR